MDDSYIKSKINTVIQGDCLEIMKQIPDKYFDLILTDPPYVLDGQTSGLSNLMSLQKFRSKAYNDIISGFDINIIFNEFKRILKIFNLFCFCSNKQISEIMNWGEKNNFFTTLLVWHKTNSTPFSNGTWRPDIEFCIHIRGKGASFEGDANLKQKVTSLPANISQFGHPTEKPLSLINKYLHIGAKKGHKVFDPFLGSGTTAVAAKSLGLDWCGCELQPEYVEIANKRLSQIQADMFGI